MKEYYEDDRCIIPEEIKKMSNEELQKKIAQFEQAGKTHKAAQVPYRPTRVTLPYHSANCKLLKVCASCGNAELESLS